MSDRDAAANADMKRLMSRPLPDLHSILAQVDAYVQLEAADLPTFHGIAADLKLWKEASEKALIPHYHQFESPRTHAERVKTDLQAEAKAFAADITRLNMNEAVDEYIKEHVSANDIDHAERIAMALAALFTRGEGIETEGVTSLADKVRRDSWNPNKGGGGHER